MSFSTKSQLVGGGCPPNQSMSQMNNNQQNDGLQGNNMGTQNPAANLLAAQSGLQSNLTANFVAQQAANAHLANLASSQLNEVPSLVSPLSLANMTLQQQQQLQPLMQMLFNQPQFQNVLQNQPKQLLQQQQQQYQQLGGAGEPLALTRMLANVSENLQANKQANGNIAAVSAAIQAQLPSQTTLMLSSASNQNFQQQKASNRPNVTLTKTSNVLQQHSQQQSQLPSPPPPPIAPTQIQSASQEQPQQPALVQQTTTNNNNNNHDQSSPSKPVPSTPKNAQANSKNSTTSNAPLQTASSNVSSSSSSSKQNQNRNSTSHQTATPSAPAPNTQPTAPPASGSTNITNSQKPQVTSPPTGATPTVTKTTAPQSTPQRSPMKLATISAPRIKQQNVRKSNASSVTKSPASASTAAATTSATPPSASASTSNQPHQKEKVDKEKDKDKDKEKDNKEKDNKEKESKEKEHKECKDKDSPAVALPANNNSVTAATPKSSKASIPIASVAASATPQTPDDSREKRKRIRTTPYQSPIPELALISKLTANEVSSPRSVTGSGNGGGDADKLTLFYKNEFLAVRNADDGFFLCQTLHNIYKSVKPYRIRIRWLSEKGKDQNYQLDFYDYTDMECILTNVELKKLDKQTYRLPPHELERIQNILKKAIDVEKGILPRPDVTEENPDGLDLSIYTSESQLEKKTPQKRKAESSTASSSKVKSTQSGAKKAKISSPVPVAKKRPSSRKSGKVSYAEDPSDEEFDDNDFLQAPSSSKSKASEGKLKTSNSKTLATNSKTAMKPETVLPPTTPEKKTPTRAVAAASNSKTAVIEKPAPVATTVSRADRAKRRSVVDESPEVPAKKSQTTTTISTSATISTSSSKAINKKSPTVAAKPVATAASTTNTSKAKSKAPVDPLAISEPEAILPTVVIKSTPKSSAASSKSSSSSKSSTTTIMNTSTSSNRRSGRK